MSRFVLNDQMWEKLEVMLPKLRGRPPKDNRLFLEAVCWTIRTGAPWRDLPKEYGPWKTTYNRYNNWVKENRFQGILEVLKKRWRSRMAHD